MKKEKLLNILLIIFGVLTLIICGVMNLYLIPVIENTTNGIRIFDMNSFGYSYETARNFVSLLSEKGLKTYLYCQLPLDFIYPVTYTAFFMLALNKLKKGKKLLMLFPICLMIFDYTENIFSEIMLHNEFSAAVSNAASAVTVCKSLLMYITIGLIITLTVIKLLQKNKMKHK